MTLNIKENRLLYYIDSAVNTVFAPFQSMITSVFKSSSDMADNYIFVLDIHDENKRLKKELDQLRMEKKWYAEKEEQYKRLTSLFELSPLFNFNTVIASVIGVEPSTWSKMIFINKGTGKGIERDMAVITADGIVGRVSEATMSSSKVILLTDIRSAVDVLVQRSRARGIVVGTNSDICIMKYVSITADIQVGDTVVSSGLGGIFPKGIMVGTVTNIDKEKHDLFQYVEMTPAVEMSKLEEVLIVTKH